MPIFVKNKLKLSVKVDKITREMKSRFKEILVDTAAEIAIRTQSGKEIEGKTFVAYAPSTIRQKLGITKKRSKKTGKLLRKRNEYKSFKSKQVSPPNLTDTGKMIGAAKQVKITETKDGIIGIIGFSSEAERKKAKYNQRKRPWFGLSAKQKANIVKKLKG